MRSWHRVRMKADRRHPWWQSRTQGWRRCSGVGGDRAILLMIWNKVLTLRFAISRARTVSKQQLYEDSPAHQVNKTCVCLMFIPILQLLLFGGKGKVIVVIEIVKIPCSPLEAFDIQITKSLKALEPCMIARNAGLEIIRKCAKCWKFKGIVWNCINVFDCFLANS